MYRPAPQAEIQMLPPALSDLIPEKDICRVISAFVDALPAALAAMAEMLIEQKYIQAQEYFVDGTIVDADANKHSHVWRKNIARYKQQVQERAREILDEAAAVDAEEDAQRGGRDLPASGDGASIAAVDIRAAAKKWSDSDDARRKKASKALTKEAVKLERYEAQEATLGERNSYSKTDEDATFMRTKDDLLRPAYNVQAGVQDDFVTGVSVSQNANDGAALRKKRGWQIETVWGCLKRNLNFRRFSLRGLGKATVEIYWLSLSHNLTLLAKRAATASHTGGGGPSGRLGWSQTG